MIGPHLLAGIKFRASHTTGKHSATRRLSPAFWPFPLLDIFLALSFGSHLAYACKLLLVEMKSGPLEPKHVLSQWGISPVLWGPNQSLAHALLMSHYPALPSATHPGWGHSPPRTPSPCCRIWEETSWPVAGRKGGEEARQQGPHPGHTHTGLVVPFP